MPTVRRIFTAALAILAMASTAHAATQGTLGATSTGSANISITKSVQAQIVNGQLYGPLGNGLAALIMHMNSAQAVDSAALAPRQNNR